MIVVADLVVSGIQCILGPAYNDQKDAKPLKRTLLLQMGAPCGQSFEFFLNVFTEFSDKKYLSLKGLEPATPCERDQAATTAPARHMCETGSLN